MLAPTLSWLPRLAAAALILASCANPIVANVPPTPSPVPTPAPPPTPTFDVIRGDITDIVQSTGRVVAVQQQDLYFRQPGNLSGITVKIQDKVKKGQVLASLDTSTLQKQIAQQQDAVDSAKLDLQSQQTTSVNANVGIDQDIKSADAGVVSAQAALDVQQAKLTMLTNPSKSDIAHAQAAVTSAQSGLTSAQLTLQQEKAGPQNSDLQKAQAGVTTAASSLTVAKQKLADLQAGPNAVDLNLAKAKLQSAQNAFDAAKATYDAFVAGPTNIDRQKAQLAITQAQNALYAAQVQRDAACANAKAGVNVAGCNAANASVNTAQTTLDAANQALAQLAVTTPYQQAQAQAAFKQAQADLSAAQATYDQIVAPPDPATMVAAQQAVTQAQAALQMAQASQNGLYATPNQIAQAQQNVVSAQAALDAANATLDALMNPIPEVIQQQKDAVTQAQSALTTARAGAAKQREIAGQGDTTQINLAIYQKKVDSAQLGLDALNDQLNQMQIVAPFDGEVIDETGQPGDRVSAYTAVITIADPSQLQIAVSPTQDQLPKIAIGQTAVLTMDAYPGVNLNGTVSALPSVAIASSNQNSASPGAAASSAASAAGTVIDNSPKISVKFPTPLPDIGTLARVTITVQHKANVLIIPTSTVNRLNNRTFVLLDDNGRQRPVDIQIGIQTDQDTEVISGLNEGQKVFSRGL